MTLTVNYDKATGAKYSVRDYKTLRGYVKVKVSVTDINVTGYSGWDPKQVLEVENEMRIIRYFPLSSNSTDLVPAFTTSQPTADVLNVGWTFPSAAHENMTQLEWAYVESEMEDYYNNDYDMIFRNNSTRIDLNYNATGYSYNVPLLYPGPGKLYYRARAVHRTSNGTLITGPWSAVSASENSFGYAGHEDSLNWQSSTSFAEDGKYKSVIQYFDGSLRSRQTVTKDNTTGNTIVGETIYDLQGRPNVQILPTPTNSNTIQYFPDFNRFNGMQANDDPAKFFDLTPAAVKCQAPPALDTAYGNGRYYSANNDWLATETKSQFIPNAHGYAYTETRFTDDATQRVKAQGGVGPDHQVGSGHETKYYYGKPSQPELDALFGTEAGDAGHYFKNMVQDANGQMSVSYVDMHGRTIATALAGDAPQGIDSIMNESDYPLATGTIKNDLLTPATNILQGNALVSVSTILAPATTAYHFTYKLNPGILHLINANGDSVCFDCKYNLAISIKGENCGDETPVVKHYSNLQLVAADEACGTSMGFIGEGITVPVTEIDFDTTLAAGSYVIRKSLTINDSLFNIRKDSAMNALLLRTQQQIFDSVYHVLSTASACGVASPSVSTCDSCVAALGTFSDYKINYLSSIFPATATDEEIRSFYIADSVECNKACGIGLNPQFSTLKGLRDQMLADMVPFTGQYALDSVKDANGNIDLTRLEAKYNIFTDSYTSNGVPVTTGKPFYNKPLAENGQPFYYDDENEVDSTIHGTYGGEHHVIDTIGKYPFASIFQDSWASSLIQYHPEYSKLHYAETVMKPAYDWLDKLQNCTSYQQALDSGYSVPVNKSTGTVNDPYFLLTGTTADKDTIDHELYQSITYKDTTITIWQIANSSVLCNTTDSAHRMGCIMQTRADGLDPSVTSDANKNEVWDRFKTVYLSYRNEMVLRYINANAPNALSQVDMDTLIAEGKQLSFASAQDIANQNGWTWWANVTNKDTTITTGVDAYATSNSLDNCTGQKPFWKARLMQCEQIKTLLANNNVTDSNTVNTIINTILDSLVMVCHNSMTPSQPYGASTVNPSYSGAPRSFEEVINNVFNAYGIHTLPGDNYFCNPFTVDYPKPFGSNPPIAVNYTNTLDSCACGRFASLKAEAASIGYDTLSFSSMNGFFTANYNDTLTSVLWDGLQQCTSLYRDTCSTILYRQQAMPGGEPTCATCTLNVYDRSDFGKPSIYLAKCEINFLADFTSDSTDDFDAYVDATLPLCDSTGCVPVYMPVILRDFVPLPPFFNCDYIKPCISCSTLKDVLTPEFRQLYPDYGGVPYLDSAATEEQIQQNALWARFLNYRTGFSKNAIDYMTAYQNCLSGNPPANALCALDKPMNDATDIYTATVDACEADTTQAQFISYLLLQAEKDSLIANFDSLYRAKCLNIGNSEAFYVTYRPKEYHYTLYYYDQAGNLVKTMPPAAVKPNFDESFLDSVAAQRSAGIDYTNYRNNEQLATNYRYNTLNQVTSQQSPDGGTSHFWYDRLGRLAVSQNAKQAAAGNYSYTVYDPLGRITEVGQKPQTTAMSQVISQDTTALQTWVAGGGSKEQITRTVYGVSYYAGEQPATLEPTLYQQNLRNRVSYTQVFDTEPAGTDPGKWAGTHTAATYYSYDIAGNVDTLLQDYKDAMAIPNRYKKIVYDYDLISGKVNKVSYQHGWSDQLYHRYSYDADNRLTEVETSHDSIYWENDADYEYYRHGPLSRMVLGENQVQGLDYAYTIQGWLKGVNSTAVLPTFDMGGDGSNTSSVGRDAFGFSLNYYNGDYKPIGSTVAPFAMVTNSLPVLTDAIHTGNDLFNGNIRAMLVNVPQLGSANLYAYRYDQLNRIKAMNSFTGFDNSANLFTNGNPAATENYKERVTYDPNGNIRTYLRNGDAARVSMDDLNYTYKTNTNQLDKVVDAATDAAAGDYDKYNDIKRGQADSNYRYDAIGNLVKDSAGGISNIIWNVYGKISSIKKTDSTMISYSYDASGNRINKKVTKDGFTKTTVYVRDATGNVMSIYAEDPAINSGHLTQTEADLYGSSRLGVWNMSRDVSDLAAIDYSNYSSTFERGNKFFELDNHLGNVLATVSDKKIGVDINSDGVVDYSTAEVVNANDYYPFGMLMPSRKYSVANTNYRYGFNGMEDDNEIKGPFNTLKTEWREYDPRLGRWFSSDPLVSKFPGWSPYVFAFDNPIWLNDPEGNIPPTIKQIITEGKKRSTVFSSLLIASKITEENYNHNIFYGNGTYTEDKTGIIVLTKSEDIKLQIIKLTHELTNRKNINLIQKTDNKVAEGRITPKEYAKQLAQIEVEGEINQIKVAAQIGYRYKGENAEGLNKLIDKYSKDKSIDLTKIIVANSEHLSDYEQQGKDLRNDYLKKKSDSPKN
ncbi:MAG: RHS repeat-associated core domain-containing protein [Ginsengibacter sp.]